MFYQLFGYLFGLVMAIHYYGFLVFLPMLLDLILGDD